MKSQSLFAGVTLLESKNLPLPEPELSFVTERVKSSTDALSRPEAVPVRVDVQAHRRPGRPPQGLQSVPSPRPRRRQRRRIEVRQAGQRFAQRAERAAFGQCRLHRAPGVRDPGEPAGARVDRVELHADGAEVGDQSILLALAGLEQAQHAPGVAPEAASCARTSAACCSSMPACREVCGAWRTVTA